MMFDTETTPMLTPTDVLEHLWCPRFTWFMHVQHIDQHEDQRYKVQKGKRIHQQRDDQNKSYLRKKIGVIKKQNEVYLASAKLRLRGFVDEVLWLKDGSMAPLDYKYTEIADHKYVYQTHETQIIIYALLIEDNYQQSVNKGFIAYIRGQQQLKEVILTSKNRQIIQQHVDDIFAIIATGRLPKRARNKRHCSDCCYKNICVPA